MIPIILDDIPFEVYGDRTLWCPKDEFTPAPGDWATLARALVCCDYEDRDGHTCVADRLVLTPVDGNGVHFPLRAGMPPIRATKVVTGMYEGQKVISVLEWDDPLNNVLTATEADECYGKASGTARQAIKDGYLPKRKSGGTYLIRRIDAEQRWG